MAFNYGTLTTLDTLRTTQQTVIGFGEDKVWDAVDAALAAHRRLLAEKVSELVDVSADRLRRHGGNSTVEMVQMDQFGTPDVQKISAGYNIGFPLRLYGGAVQWTRKYFQVTSVAEFMRQFDALLDADVRQVDLQIRKALFNPTNYTFKDVLIDNVDLPVKALVNADSLPLPIGQDGTEFNGATHTHYLGTASLTAANITSLWQTVAEHFETGTIRIYINSASEQAVRGFTSNFVPYTPTVITPATSAPFISRDVNNLMLKNRPIGLYDSVAEVWIKPWIPANYMVALRLGDDKPLVLRTRTGQFDGLQIVSDLESYPLRARTVESEYGIAVGSRVAAAVLQTNSGTYSMPTLAA